MAIGGWIDGGKRLDGASSSGRAWWMLVGEGTGSFLGGSSL